MIESIDLYNGEVVFNDLDLIVGVPLSEQIDLLKEDLLQIDYDNLYLIDVGWYPEFDINGSFKVLVVHNYDWASPQLLKASKSIEALLMDIELCIRFVLCQKTEL